MIDDRQIELEKQVQMSFGKSMPATLNEQQRGHVTQAECSRERRIRYLVRKLLRSETNIILRLILSTNFYLHEIRRHLKVLCKRVKSLTAVLKVSFWFSCGV